MNDKELKDFQEKERQEKQRLAKAEQEKKAQEDKKEQEKKAQEEKKRQEEKARKEKEDREKKEREDKERTGKEDKQKEDYQKSEKDKGDKAIKDNMEKEEKARKEAHDKESERVKNLPKANAYGEGWKKPSDPKYAYTPVHAVGAGVGMTGYDASTVDRGAVKASQEAELKRRHGVEQKHNKDDGPQPDRVAADRGPDKPGPAPAHATHGKPWHEKHGGHPDHASTILKDKAHAAMEGEKPWQRQHADPDRAESRMAQQSREREQERGR